MRITEINFFMQYEFDMQKDLNGRYLILMGNCYKQVTPM